MIRRTRARLAPAAPGAHPDAHPAGPPGRSDESGYVLVLMAVLLPVLCGIAALVIDVGFWYVTGLREQRAADAAALAGVPFLPADPDRARSTALEVSRANDFTHGAGTVQVVAEPSGSRMRVTVSSTVKNIFGPLLGISETTVTRTAVADYAGPVPMGSPCNEFGNAPDTQDKNGSSQTGTCGGKRNLWAAVAGPGTSKTTGDAYQSGVCGSSDDHCLSTRPGVRNDDYDQDGFFYLIRLKNPVAQLRVEAFDPALVGVADDCNSNLANATTADNSRIPGNQEKDRYASGLGSEFCTSDVRMTASGNVPTPEVSTRFTVYRAGPDVREPKKGATVVDSDCQQTFQGYNGPLKDILNGPAPGSFGDYLATVFRQWVGLCTIPGASAGDYLVQVKTNGLGPDYQGGDSNAGAGINRYALRAYTTSGGKAANSEITLTAIDKMTLFGNTNVEPNFFLAKLPPGSGGKTLDVSVYDAGDAGQPGHIRILAPADSNTTFANCTGEGHTTGTLPDCSVAVNNSSRYQGKWQTVHVPIPAGFTCDYAAADGCWVKLAYDYPGSVQDTTSWTVNMQGDPVRLVE